MTSKDAARLYTNAGFAPPQSIATPCANKMNARQKSVDGIIFHSSGEAKAYQLLKLWEQAGAITNLVLQPRFMLQAMFREGGKTHRAITYKADFQFVRNGATVIVEFKGHKTEPYRIRKKLFRKQYPHLIFEEWDQSHLRGLL